MRLGKISECVGWDKIFTRYRDTSDLARNTHKKPEREKDPHIIFFAEIFMFGNWLPAVPTS